MARFSKKFNLFVFVIGFMFLLLLLAACGSDSTEGELSEVEANESVEEELEENIEEDESESGFPYTSSSSIRLEPEDQVERIAVFDYTSGAGNQQRLEWLGKEEVDGEELDHYYVIYHDAYQSLEFEAWMDENFEARQIEMKGDSDNEVSENYVPSIIASVLNPFIIFDEYYRKSITTGNGHLVSVTTEDKQLGSETLPVHSVQIYDEYTNAEYEVLVAEDEVVEIYLELNMIKGEEGEIEIRTDINELKFR